jgi:multicomponent Na+:H+ antiporter subunit E
VSWIRDFLIFVIFYLKEVVTANLKLAADIVTPRSQATPGFVVLPLDPMSDIQILLLTNLISMTPGTLSFDLSQDRRRLLLHVMYLKGSHDDVRAYFACHYVRPIRRLF